MLCYKLATFLLNIIQMEGGAFPDCCNTPILVGNMECIDRVDICHSESAFGMTVSDTVTALQKKSKSHLKKVITRSREAHKG
ncbi:MAG: hypothetical protein SCARUB_03444 [Candidatus Scalindua rubra]|uniref:Uncharacterized protein n=1 Tax=Candidatus Scalindua rubra TaxID=1872076 RepID=A0A1E3X703_9BACT|nr:MAG: hypothetical protein SCARUB_03444 [Candidatus Scalindua rubra]